MNQPLVSIVIPIYNVEHFLDRCIESVVNQTYTNLEIILVDDGSPDRCPIMCDEWAEKDSRIRVIHQANSGQGLARNAGIALAKGEYICFFDSDDYVDTTLIEKCVKSALEFESDTVLYGRWNVSAQGQKHKLPINAEQCIFKGSEVFERLLPGLFTYKMGLGIGTWSRMYRLSVLKEHRIEFVSERTMSSEDAYFALCFFTYVNCASIVPESLYYYCAHENSFSHAYKEERQEMNNMFLQTCLEYILLNNMPKIVGDHLKVRYLMYTLAHIKQLVKADLLYKEKRQELQKICDDELLQGVLTSETLALCNGRSLFFWNQFRKKHVCICYFFLWLKTHR